MATLKDYVQYLILIGERQLAHNGINMWERQRVEGGIDQLRLVAKRLELGGGDNDAKGKGNTQ